MADAEDNLRIGVEYQGADALRKFASDMEIPAREIKEMLDELARTGVADNAMRRLADRMGDTLAAGLRAKLQNLRPLFAQLNFDPGAATAPLRRGLGDPTAVMRNGLLQTDVATGKLSRSVAELQTRQAALARVQTPLQSELRTLERANVTPETKKILAQASVTSLAAPTAATMPQYTRPALTPPPVDYGQRIAAALAAPQTRAEANVPNWAKQRFEEVGREFGLTAAGMRAFQRDQAPLIAAARAEVAARMAVVRSIRAEERGSSNKISGRSVQIPVSAMAFGPAAEFRYEQAQSSQNDAFGSYAGNQPAVVQRIQREAEARARANQSFFAQSREGALTARDRAIEYEGDENRAASDAELKRQRSLKADQALVRQREQADREDKQRTARAEQDAKRTARERGERVTPFFGRIQEGRERFRTVASEYEGDENRAAIAAERVNQTTSREQAREKAREDKAAAQEAARAAREKKDADAQAARTARESAREAARDQAQAKRRARADQNYAYGSYAPNLAATARMGGRVNGTFREEFMDAFTGAGRAGGVGEMLGQTARVSLSYGIAFRALGLLQQGLQAAIQETLAYEDALTNLNVVTERTRSENQLLANSLEDAAATAGFNPSVGVELGSRAVGLYGVAQADQATQERVITTATEVATRMARVSGADPLLVQTQLAGALRSLGWGAERATEMEDTISYISRQTGQAPTELLGAVANISTLGTQAGFTPQMLAALVAQIGTTTGQNPEATAGQFRQLLSRSAPDVAREAGQIIGRDLAGLDLQEIFAAVSREDLSANQLNQFASLFGKGGSQQVATILTQQYGNVEGLAAGAEGAQGFGREAFGRVMDSINGKLGEFTAALADLGVTLIQTGILDWFAAMVVGATELMRAATELLDVFNMLPRPARAVALAIGEIYAASLLLSRFPSGKAALARIGVQEGAGLLTNIRNVNRMSGFQAGGMFRYTEQQRLDRLVNGQSGGAFGLKPAAGIAAGAVALAGLSAIKTAVDIGKESSNALREVRGVINNAANPEDLREAAAVARDRSAALSENTLGTLAVGDVADLLPSLAGSLFGGSRAATELDKIAAKAEADAQAAEDAQAARVARDPSQVFNDFTLDGLNTTVEQLANQGYSAREQLDLLNEAMGRFAQLAGDTEGVIANILPEERPFAANVIARGGVEALGLARREAEAQRDKFATQGGLFNLGRGYVMNPYNDEFNALNINQDQKDDLQERLSQRLQEVMSGLPRDGNLDQEAIDKIKAQALESLKELISPEQWRALASLDQNEIVEKAFKNSIDTALAEYTNADVSANPASYIQVAGDRAQAIRDMTASIAGGTEGANQNYVADLENAKAEVERAIADRGTDATAEETNRIRDLNVSIFLARRAVLDDALNRAKAVNNLAIAGLRGDATTARLGLQAQGAKQELDLLAQQRAQIGSAPGLTDAERQAALQQNELATLAARTNQAGTAEQQRQNRVDKQVARIGINRRADDTVGRAQDAMDTAAIRLRNATRGEASFSEAQRAYNDAQQAFAAAVVARENAADQASVAGNRSAIAKAEVDLRTTQRNLASATQGTEAYFSALASVREAQANLSAAYMANNDRTRRLASDLTDPVAQARLDVERAREQLQYDINSGQGGDVIAQSQLDLRSAQNSEESAAFSQRISDLQTAEDLGRISQAAYMSYLQSEHDRLTAIASRTRQQQEQLDQVDKLMKSAAEELQGQFNIGDIDLPSVYEVRRAMQSGAPTQVADYSNSNNVVNVNGADFGAVIQWLTSYLGTGAQVVTAATPRRI